MTAASPTFYLFWLRESGCDAGTPVTAEELPAPVRDRVLALAGSSNTLQLRMPYLDRPQERRMDESLAGVRFERDGGGIVAGGLCGDALERRLVTARHVEDRAARDAGHIFETGERTVESGRREIGRASCRERG